MSPSCIRLADVSKQWGAIAAVDELSFDIAPGQFVILLGPSGCGKSTTLRMIAGLEEATSGAIHIGERDVTRAPPGERGLSMVFQSYALFPHLSVAENIVFGLKSRRVSKPERQKRLRHVAELVDLSPYLNRKPANLSGGQRQRVALARAIVSEHPICLMDEPLSNLDARLRADMRREIKALQRRLEMTVIYVTHDQVEAMSMGDRVILMQHGHIVQDATPSDLYNHPASAFAASFIGSPAMNLLPLVAGGDSSTGHAAVIEGDTTPVAPLEAAGGQIGIRPEDISLRPDHEPGVAARIVSEEYLGADTVVHVAVGHHTLRVRVAGRPALAKTTCRLYWMPENAHLFAQNGLREQRLAPRAFAAHPRRVARPPASGGLISALTRHP